LGFVHDFDIKLTPVSSPASTNTVGAAAVPCHVVCITMGEARRRADWWRTFGFVRPKSGPFFSMYDSSI